MNRIAVASLLVCTLCSALARQPLALHPDNPHYFQFRGKPLVIVTSGEHYGAVLNLDFDYRKYLDTLQRDGMNNTRTFSGAYCEPPSAFNIASNTLAPLPGRFLSPWARSKEPGYANGGNKFDLSKWSKDYFKRLEDFMAYASKRGIIVEMNLFCPFYEDSMWRLSPMNAANNINSVGDVPRTNVYTLDKHGGLLLYQEALVRKIVTELNGFDNLYYEICNEPYFGGVTLDWQARIAQVIVDTEKKLKNKHLISQNIANDKAKVEKPLANISIYNFHYATPPETVKLNYYLDAVIGDNETGFRGTNNFPYRTEAWDFIAAGGGLYNNLDYSFIAGKEDGTFVYPASQPGGGNPQLRRQLKFLSRTIHSLDFINMAPYNELVKGQFEQGTTARLLANPGKHYLLYIRTGLFQKKDGPRLKTEYGPNAISARINLSPGEYEYEWLDPRGCEAVHAGDLRHGGGEHEFVAPAFKEDAALVIKRIRR